MCGRVCAFGRFFDRFPRRSELFIRRRDANVGGLQFGPELRDGGFGEFGSREQIPCELTRAPVDVDAELDLGGYRVGIVLALHGARRARPSV